MASAQIKVAFLAYTWRSDGKLDPYLTSMAKGFLQNGCTVDVYRADQITNHSGVYGVNRHYSLDRFIQKARRENYDFVYSINNAFLSRAVQESLSCPIASQLVDEPNHLFQHEEEGNPYLAFTPKLKTYVSSYAIKDHIETRVPAMKGRVTFLPTATTIRPDLLTRPVLPKFYNVSFVCSFLECQDFSRLLIAARFQPKIYGRLMTCLEEFKRNPRLNFGELILRLKLDKFLAAQLCPVNTLQTAMVSVVSNEERTKYIRALGKHGFKLFGNKEWVNTVNTFTDLVPSIATGKPVRTHRRLMRVYDASKISLNLPQAASGTALPYRVMDILASNALLLTKYNADSDMYKIFGADCPVVTFKDEAECDSLCEYYLKNDAERFKVVRKCNELVAKGFSFRERVGDILKLNGFEPRAATQTTFQVISSKELLTASGKIKKTVNGIIRAGISGLTKLLLPHYKLRHKVSDIIRGPQHPQQ